MFIGSGDDVESKVPPVVLTLTVLVEVSEETVVDGDEQNSSKSLQQSPKMVQSLVQKHDPSG